jgi:Protein of unknown function (DUF1194)
VKEVYTDMRPLIDVSFVAPHTRPGFLSTTGATVAVLLLLVVSFVSVPAAMTPTPFQECSACFVNPSIDLAVVLDHSGSLDATAFNIQIDGLASALRDPTVIPRDGSVGLSVISFSDQPTLLISLTTIKSASDAEALAKRVEAFRCAGEVDCPTGGTVPASNFGPAIRAANFQLRRTQNEDGEPIARRVLLLSTDGGCTDKPDCGKQAATEFKKCDGIRSQLDVMLIGAHNANEKVPSGCSMDCLVSLGSCSDQPGTTRTIGLNGCTDDKGPHDAVTCFADNIGKVLRSHVQPLPLIVTSMEDPVAGSTANADGLTLRRAIEMANANGGKTTITFNLQGSQQSKVITLNAPLPPICAPGITIDGSSTSAISQEDQAPLCSPGITIDGRNGFRDGLFIRSNRAYIHGLAIKNFNRAAITIASCNPADHVGFNQIDGNRLENNSQAGVMVLDPSPNPNNAVLHNERNTILDNCISGSTTPIDLGGDGPTANDPCDADSGPNTLLNFPMIDSVEGSPTRAVIKGRLCDVAADCDAAACSDKLTARIDVYAVTAFEPHMTSATTAAAKASGEASPLPIDSRRIISVIPLAHTDVSPDGTFEIEVAASPTCGYVVTATDHKGEGNTSELSFPCRGFAKVSFLDNPLNFGKTKAGPRTLIKLLRLENVGCASLNLRSASVIRIDRRENDDEHFTVEGIPTVVPPGQTHDLNVQFKPHIPKVVMRRETLSATQLLPNEVNDQLTFQYDGGESRIQLNGRVKSRIRLIDPDETQQPARVILRRSGDSFFVEFSIYDSNLDDVDHAVIEFFDAAQKSVLIKAGDEIVKLRQAITNRGLVQGQSFTVISEFVDASQHAETKSVRVNVIGTSSNTTASATANLSATASATASSQKTSGHLPRSRAALLKRRMTKLKID